MVLISETDPRGQKSVQLALQVNTWRELRTRDGELFWAVPSQTTDGLVYLVTEWRCTCEDFRRHGLHAGAIGHYGLHIECKHQLAVQLVERARGGEDSDLVLERLPSGEYAWLRKEYAF
jgi:hypothetical protein